MITEQMIEAALDACERTNPRFTPPSRKSMRAALEAALSQKAEGEAVAEVVWYDPALYTAPPRVAHKIIDASLAFMDTAPLGTKLYAAPLPRSPQGVDELGDDWELECRAFNAANDSTLPKEISILISDLWKAYCDMEKRALPHEQDGAGAVAAGVLDALQHIRAIYSTDTDAYRIANHALRCLFAHPPARDGFSAGQEAMREAAYQQRVHKWMIECFGDAITEDKLERAYRFVEEALELGQAIGCSADFAHRLVDYVYGRPTGEAGQEVGGVMVCLAALCSTVDLDMTEEAERELARVWTKIEKIRAKHAAKELRSPLPGPSIPDAALLITKPDSTEGT